MIQLTILQQDLTLMLGDLSKLIVVINTPFRGSDRTVANIINLVFENHGIGTVVAGANDGEVGKSITVLDSATVIDIAGKDLEGLMGRAQAAVLKVMEQGKPDRNTHCSMAAW